MGRKFSNGPTQTCTVSCQSCGRDFSSLRSHTKWCDDCRGSIKSEQRSINGIQEFRAIDGEGIGKGPNHKYVLLGVGDRQREWPDGVDGIESIFSFLYDRFTQEKSRIFGGFYLTYDWNMWLKLLPRERAWRLLSDEGIRSRIPKKTFRTIPFPVRYEGWEFDILWGKRFKIRPEGLSGANTWMYINDFGPFFQTAKRDADMLYLIAICVSITDSKIKALKLLWSILREGSETSDSN